MFFRKKDRQELKELREQLQAYREEISEGGRELDETASSVSVRLEEAAQSMGGRLDEFAQTVSRRLDEFGQSVNQLHSTVNRHDMSLEDLLEEWEQKRSDEEQVRQQIQDLSQNESALLGLFEVYLDQFFAVRRLADSQDHAWFEQLELMERQLDVSRQLCGITVIADCGTEVDYELHEVIEAITVDDPKLDKTIARIYRPGYIYKGSVRRKAQVAACKISVAG